MNEITSLLLRYREYCRFLWNTHLLGPSEKIGWDLVDEFRGMTAILFRRLVEEQVGGNYSRSSNDRYIQILPAEYGTSILINRPSSDGCNYWDDPITRVSINEIRLQFVDFFDWDELGPRDFRYYETIIREFNEHPDRVGRRALIEVVSTTAEITDHGG